MDIYPVLRYRDAHAAIDWLEQAFGFERHSVHDAPDGTVAHAEMRHGDGVVMFGSQGDDPGRFGHHAGQGWLYVAVDDPDIHYERAKAPAPRSSWSSPTRTTARASTAPAIRRETTGASGPTGRRPRRRRGAGSMR